MDNVCVSYYKCIVVKLDPFGESCIVLDRNCTQCQLNGVKCNIKKDYPSKDGYASIFRKQKIGIL